VLQIIKPADPDKPGLIAITPDAEFEAQVRNILGGNGPFEISVHSGAIETFERPESLDDFAVVLVDLDDAGERDIEALQSMIGAAGDTACVVALRSFDEGVARGLLQARISDFVMKPVDGEKLAAACTGALHDSHAQDGTDADIVTFLPATGGVGCSTLAIHTALLLQEQGRRRRTSTCLVDLDFQQGVCAEYLDLEPRLELTEIEPRPERLDRQLLEVMLSRHGSGLSVVAAPGRPGEQIRVEIQTVARLLDLVSANFTHVVIDLPRHWFSWTDGVLLGSNRLLVVAEMTVPALRQARRLATVISERIPGGPRPEIVVNRYEQRAFGAGLGRSDIEQALGGYFVGTVANSYRLVRDAIDQGVPISAIKPRNPVLDDLKKLVLPERTASGAQWPILGKVFAR
jgi:pilus assembly protein CpaE